MTYQVLARKWRPKDFASLVGQEHVVRALTHALDGGRLHHAYLFTGTRGVGKTTLSRIFAKALNCETGVTATPCGVCRACREIDEGRFVDYVEMDAASNRGVDEMAALLERAVYAPVDARFKVYMIDEVHMLTNHAFNAMLKTLEEPPSHVKFILATTDPQKIPVTVLSRCLQFNLKQMPAGHIVSHLENILGQEQIPFEAQALRLLARAADGSMRDALSLTDQAIAYSANQVTEEAVRGMLGALDQSYLIRLLDALLAGDGAAVLAVADEMALRSLSFTTALQDLASLLHRIGWAQFAPASVLDDWPEAADIRRFAGELAPEQIQLFYQIATVGRAELGLAPDEYAGFTMTLLRMLAFEPAAGGGAGGSPGAGPAGVARGGGRVAAGAAGGVTGARTPAVASADAGKVTGAGAPVAAAAAMADVSATARQAGPTGGVVRVAAAVGETGAPTAGSIARADAPVASMPAAASAVVARSKEASAEVDVAGRDKDDAQFEAVSDDAAEPSPVSAAEMSPIGSDASSEAAVAPEQDATNDGFAEAAAVDDGSTVDQVAVPAGAMPVLAPSAASVPPPVDTPRPAAAPVVSAAAQPVEAPAPRRAGGASAALDVLRSAGMKISSDRSRQQGAASAQPGRPVAAAVQPKPAPRVNVPVPTSSGERETGAPQRGAMASAPRANASQANGVNGASGANGANSTTRNPNASGNHAARGDLGAPPPWDDVPPDDFIPAGADDAFFAPPDDSFMPVFDSGPDDVRMPQAAPAAPPADLRPLPPGIALNPIGFDGDWPALAAGLSLTGIAYQLAFNSELTAIEGRTLQLNVPVPQYADASQVAKLKAALAERLADGVDVVVTVGPARRTAAALDALARAERQRDAEREIGADPFVQSLIRDFGASIVQGSIRPLSSDPSGNAAGTR